MKCEMCRSDHDGSYGSGRFCSSVCARGFSTREKRSIINDKVKRSLLGRGKGIEDRICPCCGSPFSILKRKKIVCCSVSCAAKIRMKDPLIREKLKTSMLKKVLDGTHKGWKSRKGKFPSYPEKFFMDVLRNNNILFERECSCGKYFVDFALHDKKIGLEIDGKQHLWKERREKDLEKDTYLISQGWRVYRVLWKSINDEEGKKYISSEIQKFLEFYRSVA